jgi:FlaA1/EpsC-like NDP-sugar epimerase
MATTLQEFYCGRVVLVTGASGFLGKALLVKLLLSCPDIERIIVLLRKKKEENVSERLSATLSSSVSAARTASLSPFKDKECVASMAKSKLFP